MMTDDSNKNGPKKSVLRPLQTPARLLPQGRRAQIRSVKSEA
jgi:hypothetical protein